MPASRVCDGAFWYLVLYGDGQGWGAGTLYEKLLPAANNKPLLANWATPHVSASSSAASSHSSFSSIHEDELPLGSFAEAHWRSAVRLGLVAVLE